MIQVNANGSQTLFQTLSQPSLTQIGSRTWERTPNYQALRKSKYPNLPMQPYQVYHDAVTHYKGTYSYSFANNGRYPGYLFQSPAGDGDNICGDIPLLFINPTQAAELDAEARSKTLGRLKNSPVNLALAFAERMQTANMLANTASRIAFSYYSLKKGDRLGALASFAGGNYRQNKGLKPESVGSLDHRRRHRVNENFLGSTLLEIQYGWKPLLSDIYGSALLLANIPFRKSEVRCIGGEAKVAKSFYIDDSRPSVRRLIWQETRTEIKYTIFRSVDNPVSQTLAQVGISNPALLAWETTPYSLVVDWFLPVGKYLENLDATMGLSFVRGCKTVATICDTKVHAITKPGVTQFFNVDMKGSRRYVDIGRTRLIAFPSQDLPTFKNPFSFVHATNAIALLSQLRGK